jgi:hypothetical protein
MNNPTRTTRRAALVGALVSTAALASATWLPVSAAAVTVTTLPDLIRAHQKAYRSFSAAVRAQGRLEDKVRVPQARVVVGEMLDFVNDIRRPLTVVSFGELEHHAARYVPANVREAWITDKSAELRRAIRRQRYAETKSGLAAAIERCRVTSMAEEAARLNLVACRPADAAEAARKASYMARATVFREDWHHDERFVDQLVARMGEVA